MKFHSLPLLILQRRAALPRLLAALVVGFAAVALPAHAADVTADPIASNAVSSTATDTTIASNTSDSGDGSADGSADTPPVNDPFEKVNRVTFGVNKALDQVIFQPVARAYNQVVPDPAKNCIGHFFGNMADVRTALNDALQGKLYRAESDVCRVMINTTIGVLGCFDVASKMGVEKHKEDFGQTLGVWGVPAGPYVVVPLFGPSTLTDSLAEFTVDNKTDLIYRIKPTAPRNAAGFLRLVDKRAGLLDAGNLVNGAALDEYLFIRDAFLARRRSLIYDGNPPEDRKMSHSSGSDLEADTAVSASEGAAAMCSAPASPADSAGAAPATPGCASPEAAAPAAPAVPAVPAEKSASSQ